MLVCIFYTAPPPPAATSKGLSQSALPYRRSVPTWLKTTSDEVKEHIYKLAKKGLPPSQIGESLSHGVSCVCWWLHCIATALTTPT